MKEIRELLEIVATLQDWLDRQTGPLSVYEYQYAWFTYSMNGVTTIGIGDVPLWTSEGDSSEERTVEYCRNVFINHCRNLSAFIQETP